MLNFILGVMLFASIYTNGNNYVNQIESSFVSEDLSISEYNDSFVALIGECTDANQALFQTFNTEGTSIEDIKDCVQDNIDVCQKSLETALSIGDYNNDSSLKDVVVELLELELDYLDKFSRTSNYRDEDNISDEDKAAYDGMVSDLNQSQVLLNQQITNLQDVQEAFAEKYGLELE